MAHMTHDTAVHEWIEKALGVSMEGLMRLELIIAVDDVVHVKTWRQADVKKLVAANVPFTVEERPQVDANR